MSSRTLLAILLLLGSSAVAVAQRQSNGRASQKDDSRSSDFPETSSAIPREVGGKTYAEWKRDLKHPDPSARTEAIRVLPSFLEQAADAIPDLIYILLHDGDASPRVKSAIALRMMYLRPTDRVPVIKALGECLLRDDQSIIRYEAAVTLQQPRFGRLVTKEERSAINGLVASAGSRSTYELRDVCITGLIVAGPDPKDGPEAKVTDVLILRANSSWEPTLQVRLKAIMALGALGRPQDPQKLSQVLAVLKQRNNWDSSHKAIRIWSHVAMMSLEEKVEDKYLQVVAGYLKDKERETRVHAVMAFGALEEKAHDYLGEICAMMRREKEPLVLAAGCNALGHIGDQGEKVLQTLITLTEEDDTAKNEVVLAACSALAQIGVANKDVLDAMNKVLDHKSMDKYQKSLIKNYIKEVQTPKKKEKKNDKRPPQGKNDRDRNSR